MLFEALKTNVNYITGKQYELDENDLRVKNYIRAGVLVPIKKPDAIFRRKKTVKPAETK